MPALWSQNIYGPWLKAAQKMTPHFSTFAYDWRRDNNESLERFIAELEAVRQRNGGKPARVVAHSMGGMMAYAALGQRPDLFRCLVLAGAPLHGGIGFLEDLRAGKKDGLNSQLAPLNFSSAQQKDLVAFLKTL